MNMSLSNTVITFIGAGNMAKSIAAGLIKAGVPSKHIRLSAPASDKLQATAENLGVGAYSDNKQAVKDANVVILAVKPAKISEVCNQIKQIIEPQTLVISVAAGITCELMSNHLGYEQAIVRCMPNTPSMIEKGASGLFANAQTSTEQKVLAEAILAAVGICQWVDDEAKMDAITALSGSGPAYFFLFMEAMVDSAVTLGLDPESARALAIQTCAGAAELANHSDSSLSELRRQVTSPNGTTEKAINTFEEEDLRGTVTKAMSAAKNRAQALAIEMAKAP